MNLIKNKKYFLAFSGALVIACWVLVAIFGLKQGIDLTGGAEWQIKIENPSTETETVLKNILVSFASTSSAVVKSKGEKEFIIRMPEISEVEHIVLLTLVGEKIGGVTETSFYNIGPAISEELRNQALKAAVFVLLGISIYIAWAFRKVSKPVASWKYGLATLVTLFHDVSIPIGLLAVLGYLNDISIDTNFIVGLLVVMGFSVHDTIVVFDRIRENLTIKKSGESFAEIINMSVKETIVRSINTSLTLFLVLLAMVFWGPPSLFYFALTILLGTTFGTYSSICVASPLVYILQGKKADKT